MRVICNAAHVLELTHHYQRLIYAPSWADDWLIKKMSEFPLGRRDDLTDTATQALGYMRRTGRIKTDEAMSYAEEKFYQALTCLISEGPLRGRLAYAAQYLVRLQPAHFKDAEHLKAWERIKEDLTWAEADHRGEGKISATTKRMIDHDAHRVATKILHLFQKLSSGKRKYGGGHRLWTRRARFAAPTTNARAAAMA
jgi:hypothetical protein